MGVQIITGNTSGDSFGKGFLDGIEEQKKKAEKQKVADDFISVVSGMVENEAESVKAGMEPAYTPPATETLSTGKWGGVQVPSYAQPIPNPLEGKVDALADGFVKSLHGLTTPEAIALAAEGMAGQLDALKKQELQARLAGDLRAAAKGGLVEQAEVEQFAGMLEAGEDPVQVYKLFSEVREEAVREQINAKRTVRFIESGRLQEAALRQTADTIVDPDEKAWATSQAQELAAKLDEIEVYASGGIDSFDFDGAMEEVREIKNRLNPYQQQRVEQREVAYREGMDALSRVMTMEVDSEDERTALIEQTRKQFGLPPLDPVAATGGGAGGGAGARGGDRSHLAAAVNSAMTTIDQAAPQVASIDTTEDLDAFEGRVLQQALGIMAPNAGAPEGDQSWSDLVEQQIVGLQKSDPTLAHYLGGSLLGIMDIIDARRGELNDQASRAERDAAEAKALENAKPGAMGRVLDGGADYAKGATERMDAADAAGASSSQDKRLQGLAEKIRAGDPSAPMGLDEIMKLAAGRPGQRKRLDGYIEKVKAGKPLAEDESDELMKLLGLRREGGAARAEDAPKQADAQGAPAAEPAPEAAGANVVLKALVSAIVREAKKRKASTPLSGDEVMRLLGLQGY